MNDTQILLAIIRTVLFAIAMLFTVDAISRSIVVIYTGKGKISYYPTIWSWVVWFASMQYIG